MRKIVITVMKRATGTERAEIKRGFRTFTIYNS